MTMIDEKRQLFPLCIVWTILPCITWLIPVIGHAAICDETGTIYEFLGYHINVGYSVFGKVAKYVPLEPCSIEEYGQALKRANSRFADMHHNLCCNNCHHHVAEVLNQLQYKGRADWSQFDIWWLCIKSSSFVDWCAVLKVYLPFLIIVGVVLGIVFGVRS